MMEVVMLVSEREWERENDHKQLIADLIQVENELAEYRARAEALRLDVRLLLSLLKHRENELGFAVRDAMQAIANRLENWEE